MTETAHPLMNTYFSSYLSCYLFISLFYHSVLEISAVQMSARSTL